MIIGILALQGDFASHQKVLIKLGVKNLLVRTPEQLKKIDALIIPGGESTTLLKFFEEENFFEPIKKFHQEGKAIFGTCAGAIVLAKNVIPEQKSLGLIDITIQRNAYGRQLASTVVQGTYKNTIIEVVLIRAPKIMSIGDGVKVLGEFEKAPLCLQQNNVMVATFHPELTNNFQLHEDFLALAKRGIECQTLI